MFKPTTQLQAGSLLATALLVSAPSLRVLAAEPSAGTEASEPEEVVVTGSRLTQTGYEAPTPVTVALASDLLKSSPTGIADGLIKLPQFIGSTGPNRQANIFGTPNHGTILNLRGVGPTRTLILLDGVRAPPTTYLNTVDVNLFPSLLVQRVDVVTAGASSVYGSDAVSGVVNYVLDSRFTGFKGLAQGGFSTHGDAENQRYGLAAGTDFADGRAHIVASVDYTEQNGYPNHARPKLDDRGVGVGSTGVGAAGTASNPLIQMPEIRASFATYGGLATSGPFANTNFVSPGVYRPVVRGTPTGTPTFFQADGDYIANGRYLSASADTQTAALFTKLTYDFSDNTSAYLQLSGARSDISYTGFANLLFAGTTVPVFSGNPFIPAPLQAQLTSAGTASFNVAKLFDDLGPITTDERVDNYTVVAGLEHNLGRFRLKLDYAYGNSDFEFSQSNQFELSKLAAALDAVVNPANGAVVCRPTLSTDPAVSARYAGCVPFNTLGLNAASAQAAAYVMGTSTYDAVNSTHDVVGSISGDLWELPAGPVSAAFGLEYRTADLKLETNSNPGTPVDVTGLRGIAPTTVRFYLTNVAAASGDMDVKEAFTEVGIPLLKDKPFARQLDLNGAYRWTDYSTSGNVETWKLGATWTPVDLIKFRATQSRDIRAPTLFDLYAGSQFSQGAALDPHTNIASGFNQITSGNPDLEPEIGNTFTAGFILQPQGFNGSLSVDYYDLEIEGAITTLTATAILQDCEVSGGTAPSCANIQRPLPFSDRSPANFPTQVTVSGVNASLIRTQGIDFDASYSASVGPGLLSARLYATKLLSFETQLAGGQPIIEYAGYNAAGSGGVTGGLPEWKGSLSLNYDLDQFSVFVQQNYIGSLEFGPIQVYADRDISSFQTTDLTLTYRLPAFGSEAELFGSVTNAFDNTPPSVYPTSVPGAGLSTIVSLYDVTGRAFVVGARVAF